LLDRFLELTDYPILLDNRKITALEAKIIAEQQFDVYRIEQNKNYISDFDLEIKKK
jgi:hypothetical protein